MGKPNQDNTWLPSLAGGKPAEVKHLSKRRKRKQCLLLGGDIPLVVASEKGRAQTPLDMKII